MLGRRRGRAVVSFITITHPRLSRQSVSSTQCPRHPASSASPIKGGGKGARRHESDPGRQLEHEPRTRGVGAGVRGRAPGDGRSTTKDRRSSRNGRRRKTMRSKRTLGIGQKKKLPRFF